MDSIINGYDKIKLLDIIETDFHIHINNFETIYYLFSDESKAVISKVGPLLLLPHHVSTSDEIDHLIDNFKSFIIRNIERFKSQPKIITIARSSDDDEYTPRNVVNDIQDKVINILKELILPKTLNIHDLCEDSWNKSYSLFFNEKIKKQKII
jgi:hypothetical protein